MPGPTLDERRLNLEAITRVLLSRLREDLDRLKSLGFGVTIFAFEFEPGAIAYISTVLAAIAWWESIGVDEPDAVGVAFVAGYSPTSSSFEKARGSLRVGGYIDYPSGGAVRLTDSGRAHAPIPQSPATQEALHAAVLAKLAPREGRLLQPLLDAHPGSLEMSALAEASGYSADSSSFEKARGTIRTLGLATYPKPGHVRAADLLFPEGR